MGQAMLQVRNSGGGVGGGGVCLGDTDVHIRTLLRGSAHAATF